MPSGPGPESLTPMSPTTAGEVLSHLQAPVAGRGDLCELLLTLQQEEGGGDSPPLKCASLPHTLLGHAPREPKATQAPAVPSSPSLGPFGLQPSHPESGLRARALPAGSALAFGDPALWLFNTWIQRFR